MKSIGRIVAALTIVIGVAFGGVISAAPVHADDGAQGSLIPPPGGTAETRLEASLLAAFRLCHKGLTSVSVSPQIDQKNTYVLASLATGGDHEMNVQVTSSVLAVCLTGTPDANARMAVIRREVADYLRADANIGGDADTAAGPADGGIPAE